MRRFSAVLACAALGLALAASGAPPEGASDPAAKKGSVRLIPVDPRGMTAPSTRCETPSCEELLGLLRGAKGTIDFAVYGLRGQQAILDALTDAKRRGVVIRGIVDKDAKDMTYYSDTDELIAALGTVRTDHVHDKMKAAQQEAYDYADDRCARPPGFLGPLQCVGYDLGSECLVSAQASHEVLTYDGDIMHDKFFVVDGRYVWTGSANISDSDIAGYSANITMVFDAPEVAKLYTREVDQMYDQGKFHEDKVEFPPTKIELENATVTVWFPPQDGPTDAILRAIAGADDHIDVSIFYLTHKRIAAELIAAHRRGVKVRVIVDATSATNGYTKHELLRAAGVPVKVENWGGKMHAKALQVDGKVVFAGSMNFTSAGEGANDENIVRIESEAQAKIYREWFDLLWADIDDRWLQGRPDPESQDSRHSCTDKSDNDFDTKKDADDPGCGPNPPPIPELPPWRIVPKADGYDLIKGNIAADGKKTYHVPSGSYYSGTRVDEAAGEQYFCSEDDAKAAGYRRSGR